MKTKASVLLFIACGNVYLRIFYVFLFHTCSRNWLQFEISVFRSEDDESDYDELSDNEINKLLIVTQVTQPNRTIKHEGYDRTSDIQTRVKISQDLEQEIDLGLQIYEENLWSQQQWVRTACNSNYRRISIILFLVLRTIEVQRRPVQCFCTLQQLSKCNELMRCFIRCNSSQKFVCDC